MKRFLALIFLLVSVCGYGYTKHPSLSEEVWQNAQPYLLPMDHPLKSKLDKLCKNSNITKNTASLKKAGFTHPKPREWSQTIVSKNSKLKGYYFKLYTDEQNQDSYGQLKQRVVGARSLQEAIQRHKYTKMFKVPKKWLYPNPNSCSFILIAEDCHLMSDEGNRAYWKNLNNTALLTALYTLLQEEGLKDSIYCNNIPFNLSGEVCFIDTEHHHQWPVNTEKLTPFLSSKMQKHWNGLIQAH